MTWRILIVDDEPDVRLIVRTCLQPKYEAVEAHDGLDALEKIERYEPDFVVMDVMMPLMNGFEACAAIRKMPRFRELPVLFLSALGSKDDMKKGYSAGANLYLTKPFDPQRLLKNIDVFFEKTPPPPRARRLTLADIQEAEAHGHAPAAPGSHQYEHADPRPAAPQAAAPAQPRAPQPAAADQPTAAFGATLLPRVMVVDDDVEMTQLYRLALGDHYEIVVARDGMEAIEKLVRYQPDILVIDIMLPKMNGYQLCQSLRANRAFSRMPILMCSAKGTERDISLAKRLGADDYLTKPFTVSDLQAKMRGMRDLPSFRVRPKTLTIGQIDSMDHPKAQEDVFNSEEDARVNAPPADSSNRALARFLNKEGKKEAITREHDATEDKKKRRLFGFGKVD